MCNIFDVQYIGYTIYYYIKYKIENDDVIKGFNHLLKDKSC
ncbi:MAG: hypothetical protein V1663_01790 [archaeon]